MDIFILRDGEEIGPFGEETTQTLLNQGSVAADDLAWKPGMPGWIPLGEMLGSSAEASEDSVAPEPEPASPPIPAHDSDQPHGEPATAKQKAFLSYLGIGFPESIAKDHASILINDAMEDSALSARVGKWSEDRLRLHPDLFAAEIHARKENRANHFFDICHTEGAEHFGKITKAHCQVLVGFLDVKFPTWDARMEDAAKNYFFPAIAEKFPQLIDRQWRDHFHYAEASRSSPELTRRPTARIRKKPVTPLLAVARGLVAGIVILGALYLGQRFIPLWLARKSAEKKEVMEATPVPAEKPALAAADHSKLGAATVPEPPAAKKTKKNLAKAAAASAGTPAPLAKALDATGNPIAMAPPEKAPADPSMSAPPPAPAAGSTPAPPAAATAPETPPVAANPAPAATATPPPAAPPKTNLLLTKPIELQLAYGKVKLPVGTSVKLVSRDGALVKVNYLSSVIVVPASSTDIDSTPPAPPSASSSGAPSPAAPSPNPAGET